jgi:hypothetical protein
MKPLLIGIGTLTALLAGSYVSAQDSKASVAAAPAPEASRLDYLGQPLPGDTAVVFAKGIVSKGNVHGRLVVSPDGQDIFWTTFVGPAPAGVARMMQVTRTANGWGAPQVPAFVPPNSSSEPLFSPDGKKLFFASRQSDGSWSIQYVEKTGSGWSAPKRDGFLPNPSSSFARTGKVYYSDVLKGKTWDRGIYVADYTSNGCSNSHALPTNINSRCIDYTPFIAPDESFLMFCSSRPSREENMYLHISFRNPDGTWSTPVNMNEAIGFSGKTRFPCLSPDGKFLFFCGDDGNIYWVRSRVIDKLRR